MSVRIEDETIPNLQEEVGHILEVWDRVLKEAQNGDPNRFYDHIRPHNHVPRCITLASPLHHPCITLSHPYFIHQENGRYYLINSHKPETERCFIRNQVGVGIRTPGDPTPSKEDMYANAPT